MSDPDALEEEDAARRRRDSYVPRGDQEDDSQQVRDHYLPRAVPHARTTHLRLHWDAGKLTPDEESVPSALSLYEWGTTQWVEQVRGDSGDHMIDVEDPDRFIGRPYPVVRTRLAPLKPGRRASCPVVSLDIAYEGKNLDAGKRDHKD